MTPQKTIFFTPEQEDLIPIYHHKWINIALSTERINRKAASIAIKEAYAFIGLSEPKIRFYDSPYIAFINFINNLSTPINYSLIEKIQKPIWKCLNSQLDKFIQPLLFQELHDINCNIFENFIDMLVSQLSDDINNEVWEIYANSNFDIYQIEPRFWSYVPGSLLDFCISVLNCTYPEREWTVLQGLMDHCGLIFPDEKIVFISERPSELSFNNLSSSYPRIHAEGKPAIRFVDGYSIYAYHGVILPKKYSVHPDNWQAKWLLEEENAELRRVLIQGLGYTKILEELSPIELDSYREYKLLKIVNDIDIEPIYLLKMTCPSTGFIHVLRVPPNMKSAREAICWVNWGVDPNDFAVET
ncbi:hypothetical protein NIES2109_60230 (plasmid) [Nostoc sp. HK-01]|nr:hypothetical protein NIES2109_60230 [Nostoc sp. HK-01]